MFLTPQHRRSSRGRTRDGGVDKKLDEWYNNKIKENTTDAQPAPTEHIKTEK